MVGKFGSVTRIEQTRREFERLFSDIETWLKRREKKDALQQYHTQLNVIKGVLGASLQRLRGEFASLSTTGATAAIFARCRWFERQLIWIQRLWGHFRYKFDQRDEEFLGPVLASADEVVWSCYTEACRNAGVDTVVPAPLPYFEPLFSPQAMPRAEPPPDLRTEVDAEFLGACLQLMPVSLISLPPSCVRNPWWLILLGHEVGHHVQFDLLPDWKLVTVFGDVLGTVFFEDQHEDAAERWRQWGPEIFADAFSICMLGSPAISAMVGLEFDEDRVMLKERRGSKSAYPSPALRLALMAQIGDEPELRAGGRAALGDFDPKALTRGPALLDRNRDLRKALANDLNIVPQIASAILEKPLDTLARLPRLCGCAPGEFAANGAIFQWADALRGRIPLEPEKTLRAARLAISGAFMAWSEIELETDEDKRAAARDCLTDRIISVIPQSREEGTRAGESVRTQDMEILGDKLARLLMEAAPA